MAGDRICRDCGESKPSSEYIRSARCQGCLRVYNRAKTLKHLAKPEVRARHEAQRRTPEAIARKREYDAKRRTDDSVRSRSLLVAREYKKRPEVREHLRELSRTRENSPKWKGRRKEQRSRPGYKARQVARARERRHANPEEMLRLRIKAHLRRVSLSGEHSVDDIRRILSAQRERCAICRCRLGQKFHIDHIIPIARGGDNTPRNLQILCPPCNLSKGSRDPLDHMRQLGRLL